MNSFTLVELMIVVAIILLFSSLALFNYSKTSNEAFLNKAGKQLADIMYLARQKALSNDLEGCDRTQFVGYKVVINQTNFALQRCCPNCNSTDPTIVSYDFPNGIIWRSGLREIQFNHLGAVDPANGGSVVIESPSLSGNACFIVTISPIGVISTSDSLVACN